MMKGRFDSLGVNTVHVKILTRTYIATIEPENLKCVLASDFRNYSLGDERKAMMKPFLGEGIFTTDGKESVPFIFFNAFFPEFQWSLKREILSKLCLA